MRWLLSLALSVVIPCGAFATSTNAWQILQVNTGTQSVVPAQHMGFQSTVSASDPTNTSDLVTLRYLDRALGSIATLYASTNQDLGIAGYYDARTFLPVHSSTILEVAGCTNNQYVGMWVSNTNLISNIRNGIGVVVARMRLNSPVAGKTLVVKPEIYRRTVADGDIELYEAGENITLSGTMTEYEANIDCSTNAAFAATDRAVVKWKVVSQTGSPTWYFEVGQPYIIAARFPVSLGGGADAVTIGTAQTVTGAKVLSAFNGTLNGTLDAAGNSATNVGNWHGTNIVVQGNISMASGSLVSGQDGKTSIAVLTNGFIRFGTNQYASTLTDTFVFSSPTGSTLMAVSSVGGGSTIICRKSGGTWGAETANPSNDALSGFSGAGHNGSAWTTARGGTFVYTAEAWNTTNNGTYVRFDVTPLGSVTRVEKMRLKASGQLGMSGGTVFPTVDIGAGDIFYHTTSNKHFGYNGSSWNALY
jgi:hypothetical protein